MDRLGTHRMARRVRSITAIAALAATLAAAPSARAQDVLTGDEIRTLISGNSLHGSYLAKVLRMAFYPDGKLLATLTFAGSDWGTWMIKGDLYCQTFTVYFGAAEHCYRWVREGNLYKVENEDTYRTYGFQGEIHKGYPEGF